MARQNSMPMGGGLTLFGSLVYLYLFFTWYGSGAVASTWLTMAGFLAPFVVAFGIFSVVSLFFMSVGTLMGKMPKDPKMAMHMLWKFIMAGAISFLIITGGGAWFWWAFVAFILTYLGGMASTEM
jgi:hypothetical protein